METSTPGQFRQLLVIIKQCHLLYMPDMTHPKETQRINDSDICKSYMNI